MSGEQLVGAGGTSLGALTSIGSDLSVSVSFQVASELLDAAQETNMREDELVGMVLGVAIALSALKKLLEYTRKEQKEMMLSSVQQRVVDQFCKVHNLSVRSVRDDGGSFIHSNNLQPVIEKEEMRLQSEKSLLDFALLFTSIATRIAFAVTVQLLASSARARQSSRGARILSLMALAVFFVFVESSAERRIF